MILEWLGIGSRKSSERAILSAMRDAELRQAQIDARERVRKEAVELAASKRALDKAIEKTFNCAAVEKDQC